MTSRTFIQTGIAYGYHPASIIATIDGKTVYSGPVHTVDDVLPTFPNKDWSNTNRLFTWTTDIDFEGILNLEIQVQGSDLILTETLANYGPISAPSFPDGKKSSGDTHFVPFFSVGPTSEPFTDVEIDGVPMERDDSPEGQWIWILHAGSTFVAKVNVQAGLLV